MATARSALRALLVDEIQGNAYTSLTTSSAGNAGGTTLVDTSLASLPGGGDTDFCLGWYVLITSLGASGESQRVSAYNSSTNTITVQAAFSIQIAGSTTFSLLRYDPEDYNNAINRSCELLYPWVSVPIRNETLWTHDRLTNTDYETNTTGPVAFTGWTDSGTPTLSAETTRVYHGSQSMGIQSSDANSDRMTQTLTINVEEITGKGITFKRMVYATVADRARIGLDFTTPAGDSEIAWSDYHTGADEWQHLDVTTTVPDDATGVDAICEVIGGATTAYFDSGDDCGLWLTSDPIRVYTVPTSILKGPYSVSISPGRRKNQDVFQPIYDWTLEEDATSRYIILEGYAPAGRIMKIQGTGALSTMSTDAATTEIEHGVRANLLVARAAQWLYEMLAEDSASLETDTYMASAQKWAQRVQQLLSQPGIRSLRQAARSGVRWSYG